MINDWFEAFYPEIYRDWQRQRAIHGDASPEFPEWIRHVNPLLVEQYFFWDKAHQDPWVQNPMLTDIGVYRPR